MQLHGIGLVSVPLRSLDGDSQCATSHSIFRAKPYVNGPVAFHALFSRFSEYEVHVL